MDSKELYNEYLGSLGDSLINRGIIREGYTIEFIFMPGGNSIMSNIYEVNGFKYDHVQTFTGEDAIQLYDMVANTGKTLKKPYTGLDMYCNERVEPYIGLDMSCKELKEETIKYKKENEHE